MQLRSQFRQPVSPHLRGLFGRSVASDGAILHFDADLDAFAEQTGGVHRFNHAVLSPQYQLNADGSYSNVGAKPAVDVFGGKKWLRSCGAVTNMLTNSVFAGAVSGTPGTAPTGWTFGGPSTGTVASNGDGSLTLTCVSQLIRLSQGFTLLANTSYSYTVDVIFDGVLRLSQVMYYSTLPSGSASWVVDGQSAAENTIPTTGKHKVVLTISVGGTGGGIALYLGCCIFAAATGTVTISNPQLTASAYPQPYVPTTASGPVAQPASNATTTNGSWFSLPDGSELWKALTGQPLTLATRVRMGVGSGDFASDAKCNIIAEKGDLTGVSYCGDWAGVKAPNAAYDGSTLATQASTSWPRNSIVRRITQVNTAGTQFRVGYMTEGTHTAIQWSSWVAFDGSFGPSNLYRLMLGYNNSYPMWFNKITAWKKQATDAEILEAMA